MTASRKIVEIDQQKCNGCGQCVPSCAEGAIQIVDGKARLVSDVYCDGLGACLGHCPQGAITIVERAAAAFDEELARQHSGSISSAGRRPSPDGGPPAAGCPGMAVHDLRLSVLSMAGPSPDSSPSTLRQWPVQLQLVPPHAPFLRGADLMLVADCVPLAFADFHARLLGERPLVVGCPKLDDAGSHVEKLSEILRQASLASLTVVQMEVPCCSGLMRIAEAALERSGRQVPLERIVISIRGEIVSQSPPPR